MAEAIRVLIAEKEPTDAELVVRNASVPVLLVRAAGGRP